MGRPRKNVGLVCKGHEPKSDPQYFDKPIDWFKGKFVKKLFVIHEHKEHMWVKITNPGRARDLRGTLANNSEYCASMVIGVPIELDRTEIEDVTTMTKEELSGALEDEAHGVEAIIHLQSMAGITETKEQAKKGWASMNEREREFTLSFYEQMKGSRN